MTRVATRALIVLLMSTMPTSYLAWERDAERIWILPFTQAQPDPALEYLQDALPALLAVAVSGSDAPHSLVERQDLMTVLREQSLTLDALTSLETRQRVGKLLGATIMITGSFVPRGSQLHLTVRASDLQTGIVVSAVDGTGTASQPGEILSNLYRRLAAGLGRRLPDLTGSQIDETPLSNLHFMKGLGHYHSARYSQALAEFMQAAEDSRLTAISRFWLANAYLAERQYAHACLELTWLMQSAPITVPARDVAAKLRECEREMSREDLRMLREMARRR
jgi:TolA-binding protein